MSDNRQKAVASNSVGDYIEYCFTALENSQVFYGHGTDNAWDEAVQLVLFAADLPADAQHTALSRVLSPSQGGMLLNLLQRRIEEHVPLPYLTGRAWFAGLEFACDRRAIIPRSPLAELILNEYQPWYSGPGPHRILDLCCGGGCIGLAAAYYSAAATVDLVDLDPEALALARENAARLEVADRVTIKQSNLFQAVAGTRYDLILSNPPYVDEQDLADMPAEYHHEPALALGSGADGLALTRVILARAGLHLEGQ